MIFCYRLGCIQIIKNYLVLNKALMSYIFGRYHWLKENLTHSYLYKRVTDRLYNRSYNRNAKIQPTTDVILMYVTVPEYNKNRKLMNFSGS